MAHQSVPLSGEEALVPPRCFPFPFPLPLPLAQADELLQVPRRPQEQRRAAQLEGVERVPGNPVEAVEREVRERAQVKEHRGRGGGGISREEEPVVRPEATLAHNARAHRSYGSDTVTLWKSANTPHATITFNGFTGSWYTGILVPVNCPYCKIPSMDALKSGEVEVDRCRTCGAVWFDPGEIRELTQGRLPAEEDAEPVADPSPPAKEEKGAALRLAWGEARGLHLSAVRRAAASRRLPAHGGPGLPLRRVWRDARLRRSAA